MDIRISKSEFLRGLRLAQNIADRKSTMPMLANVLIRSQGNKKVLIAATDLNVSVSASLTAECHTEGGITINAKSLFEIISSAPSEEISLKKTDNSWAEIRSGKVNYKVVGMPDRDFPKIPDAREVELFKIEASTLSEMIDRTLFSVCNDETRFHLNGVLLESNGKTARMVSTDGHRLSRVDRNLVGGPALSTGIIIPKKGVIEIKRVVEGNSSIRVGIKTPYIFVEGGEVTLAVKLIDATFPMYEDLIKKVAVYDRSLLVDRLRLLDALKRAQLMSSDTRGVKFSMSEGTLSIASENPDMGEVKEDLEVEYKGDTQSIGFNPKYLIELLTQMKSDQVTFQFGGDVSPGLFKPMSNDDYLGIIMPMKI
jgi:DNA polymerase-3 subunit beta